MRDCVDWLDFHVRLDAEIDSLRGVVETKHYRTADGTSMRVAKSRGLTRIVRDLVPRDALLYRAIVDELYLAMRRDEHPRSFFSRSRSQPKRKELPNGVEFSDGDYETWSTVWIRLQQARKLTGLSSRTKIMVMTDIASYFDSIHHAALTDDLTPYVSDLRYLQLLRYLLEQFANRAAYEPQVYLGIPQDDIDCSRVLGHLFLYSIDQALARSRAVDFTRWMDDITIAARSPADARSLLAELQRACERKHLRLNEGKTRLLDRSQVAATFHFAANQTCDSIDALLKTGEAADRRNARRSLRALVKRHLKSPREGHWSKVLKRLATLDLRLDGDYLRDQVPGVLVDHPELAEKCAHYIRKRPQDALLVRAVAGYLMSRDAIYENVVVELLRALACAAIPWSARHTTLRAARVVAYSPTAGAMARVEAYTVIGRFGDGRDWRRLQRQLSGRLRERTAAELRMLLLLTWAHPAASMSALHEELRAWPDESVRSLADFLASTALGEHVATTRSLTIVKPAGVSVVDARRQFLLQGIRTRGVASARLAAAKQLEKWAKQVPEDEALARVVASTLGSGADLRMPRQRT